jgi:hypothetical protein
MYGASFLSSFPPRTWITTCGSESLSRAPVLVHERVGRPCCCRAAGRTASPARVPTKRCHRTLPFYSLVTTFPPSVRQLNWAKQPRCWARSHLFALCFTVRELRAHIYVCAIIPPRSPKPCTVDLYR